MIVAPVYFRRGTAAEIAATDVVLASGEPGYDTTNGVLKIGNGSDAWDDLPTPSAAEVAALSASVTSALSGKVATSRTINGHELTADVTVTKDDVDLGDVDNTSDEDKPVSIAQASALAGKVGKGDLVTNVKDHGAVGDGSTNDAAAVQSAITAAAASGGVVFFPKATYLFQSTLALETGVTLDLGGSTLKVGASVGASDRLITIAGASNVRIRDGIIDGDKASFATATEQRHNIHITNSSNVEIRSVVSKNAKGDGIYVGDQFGLSSNIRVIGVTCDANHRQGLSISHVDGFYAISCAFTNTAGTAPQCGVDVEPNVDGVVCTNIKFEACTFSGNAQDGFLVSLRTSPTVEQGGIDLIGCRFNSNTVNGLRLYNARNVRVLGGDLNSNTERGVYFPVNTTANDIRFVGSTIKDNGLDGVYAQTTFDTISFESCIIRDNGLAAPNTYMGIAAVPNATSSRLTILGCLIGGTSQKYGLQTNPNLSNLNGFGNLFDGSGTADTSLSDSLGSRTLFGTSLTNISTKINFAAGSGTTLFGLRVSTEGNDRIAMRTDGIINFGPGSAGADTQLSRVAANVLGVGTDDCIRTGVAVTGSRPLASAVGAGSQFWDSTLKKPIWSDGTNWLDGSGSVVDATMSNANSIISDDYTKGVVLKDSDGHYWRVTTSTTGALTTADLGTSRPTN